MFPQLPTMIDQLRGGRDAAPLVDAAVGWARVEAASAAQRLAGIAEWASVFMADEDEDASLCAIDAEDDVVAQIGLAFGLSVHWAFRDLQVGAAMRERFPKLAAMFLRGEISAQVMSTVVERTLLVVDDDVLAAIDAACVEAATECGWSGLSNYSLKNAIDVWVERFDPDAVRRVRNTVRGRGVSVAHTDDEAGIVTITMRLTKPGGALLMGTLRSMAKAVCANDPRTLDQRMGDAAEAIHAGSRHLKCLCGSSTCSAAVDDGVASRFVVHIYGDAPVLDGQPDPLIHGDGVFPAGPDNVTVTHRKKAKAKANTEAEAEVDPPTTEFESPAENAAGADDAEADEPGETTPDTEDPTDQQPHSSGPRQCPAPADAEAGGKPAPEPVDQPEAAGAPPDEPIPDAQNDIDDHAPEPDTDQEPRSSGPRHCPAPAARDAEMVAGTGQESEVAAAATAGETEPEAARETAAPAAAATGNEYASPSPAPMTGTAPGFIPGYGVVPNALIAALIAGGAEVRHIKPPSLEPTESYRLRDADREFVQARDLTCRMPGCDRPIHDADLDHTISWGEGGPTHPSNEKGYCRHHHLLKTFRDGWEEVQHPDGTVQVTTPTGHTYTSIPLSRILFPGVNTTSAPVQRGSPRKEAAADKSVKMPKRQRTKAKDRAYRIAAERALNAAHRANGETPAHRAAAPKDNWGYRLFFGEYTQTADPNNPPPF